MKYHIVKGTWIREGEYAILDENKKVVKIKYSYEGAEGFLEGYLAAIEDMSKQ